MQNEITIGTPVYNPYSSEVGYVAKVEALRFSGAVIGASGFQKSLAEYEIVYPRSNSCSTTPDAIASPWIEEAARMKVNPIENAEELLKVAQANQAADYAERMAAADIARQERERHEAEIARKIPSWAKAVIIGELIEDVSDSMSDYWNGRTIKSVILGFSRHTRELFPEMRAAAANCPETAGLATAPDDAEHREKYSMGGGFYLKIGGRYSNGWKVSKKRFYNSENPARDIPTGQWFLNPPKAEASPAAAPTSGAMSGITIEEHTHTKKGFQMHICILPGRVDRAEFDRLRDHAQSLGGWYSKPWGKTPGGFAFKDRATAEAFAGLNGGGASDQATDGAPTPAPAPMSGAMPQIATPAIGEKLLEIAEGMASEIAGRFADRRENTPKQQRQAAEARIEGRRLERTRDGLQALAALYDAGTVPPALSRLRSKKAAYDLAAGEIDRRNSGYYDAGIDTGNPANNDPVTLAFWALLKSNQAEARAAEELRQKIAGLKFARIPGYFPTPAPLVARMIEIAGIEAHHSILEPSAGSGAIADAVHDACPDAHLFLFEIWGTLREILEGKGYTLAGRDFMEEKPSRKFDRVLMNPPFEKMADIDHVRAAHSCLHEGGRLVAIMSPGPFFREDRKAVEFRAWLDGMGGEFEKLPDGSFAESGTGVGAYIVTIDA